VAQLELEGQRFGRLVVKRLDGFRKRYFWWHCLCDCGNTKSVRGSRLVSGTTRSCGCLQKELTSKRAKEAGGKYSLIHGATSHGRWTPEYVSWYAMRQRVNNPNHEHFKYYGGRGIRICKRWEKFENFLADMGPRPKGYTLERKRNNGNYTPSNCHWATWKEQQNNKRKRRIRTHCKLGHALIGENLSLNKRGWRSCRLCRRNKRRVYEMGQRRARGAV
jgi:hypothetical protein